MVHLMYFRCFFPSFQANARILLVKVSHDHFLPQTFQF